MSMHPATPAQSAVARQTNACSKAIRRAEQAFLLLPQARAPAPVDTLRRRDLGAGSGFMSEHPATPAQSPWRGRPLLARWQSGVRSRPFCCCHRPGRRPRSTRCGGETWAPALDSCQSIRERLRSRLAAADPCLLGGNPACRSRPFCCCKPRAPPRSTRYGHETGALALILCQCIRQRLRNRRGAADQCLLGGNPACGAGLSAAATGPGAGPRSTRCGGETWAPALDSCRSIQERLRNRRGAADPCLLGGNPACGAGLSAAASPGRRPPVDTLRPRDWGRRFWILVSKHPGNACAITSARQTIACSVAIRRAEQASSAAATGLGCRPRSTRCGRETGALALILCQSIRQHLRNRQCRGRPLLARWQSGVRSRPFCCCHQASGAGPGRHAADARLARRL